MLIIVTGGGTGGHVYPGLAISARLLGSYAGATILFIGSSSGPEGVAARGAGIPFEGLRLSGLVGKNPFERARSVVQFARGTARCLRLFRRLKPVCVVGTGGYAAAPACFAASISRVPLLLHEMNYRPGLVTRLLARSACAVACAHGETAAMLPSGARVVVTGVAVRPEVEALRDEGRRRVARDEALEAFGVRADRKTLLVFGGSQGAEALNTAVWEALPRLRDSGDLQVIHLTGRRDFADSRRAEVEKEISGSALIYRALAYWERMELVYAVADLAVTRAGAGTIAELSAAGVPAVLVPFPHATEGHQESNAEQLVATGAAVIERQRDGSAGSAVARAIRLIHDRGSLERMLEAASGLGQADSAQGIVDLIKEQASGGRGAIA